MGVWDPCEIQRRVVPVSKYATTAAARRAALLTHEITVYRRIPCQASRAGTYQVVQ